MSKSLNENCPTVKYFELYPTSKNKVLKVGFNDTVKSVNRKLRGVVNKHIELNYIDDPDIITKDFTAGDFTKQSKITGVQGIKTDLQKSLSISDKLRMRDRLNWEMLSDYRYCMLQLDKYGTLNMIAINHIKGIDMTDKNRSKIITDIGEISLYELCVNTKLFGLTSRSGSNGVSSSVNLLKNVMILILDDILCFIKLEEHLDSRRVVSRIASALNVVTIPFLMGNYKNIEGGII